MLSFQIGDTPSPKPGRPPINRTPEERIKRRRAQKRESERESRKRKKAKQLSNIPAAADYNPDLVSDVESSISDNHLPEDNELQDERSVILYAPSPSGSIYDDIDQSTAEESPGSFHSSPGTPPTPDILALYRYQRARPSISPIGVRVRLPPGSDSSNFLSSYCYYI